MGMRVKHQERFDVITDFAENREQNKKDKATLY